MRNSRVLTDHPIFTGPVPSSPTLHLGPPEKRFPPRRPSWGILSSSSLISAVQRDRETGPCVQITNEEGAYASAAG